MTNTNKIEKFADR